MKNLITANHRPKSTVSETELRQLIDAQIENSHALGWAAQDIIVVTNLAVDLPATVIKAPLNETCLTGSKMFALNHLFTLGLIRENEVWWSHDLDAWQNYWFEPPDFLDIGLTEYSTPKFNGGSIFLRATARDMVSAITEHITAAKAGLEEPSINSVLRSAQFEQRVTILNSTFNVGCSAYDVRHARSHKPILVSHFHPMGKAGWRVHNFGDGKVSEGSVCPRLFELLVRRFHRGVPPCRTWPSKRGRVRSEVPSCKSAEQKGGAC